MYMQSKISKVLFWFEDILNEQFQLSQFQKHFLHFVPDFRETFPDFSSKNWSLKISLMSL